MLDDRKVEKEGMNEAGQCGYERNIQQSVSQLLVAKRFTFFFLSHTNSPGEFHFHSMRIVVAGAFKPLCALRYYQQPVRMAHAIKV